MSAMFCRSVSKVPVVVVMPGMNVFSLLLLMPLIQMGLQIQRLVSTTRKLARLVLTRRKFGAGLVKSTCFPLVF